MDATLLELHSCLGALNAMIRRTQKWCIEHEREIQSGKMPPNTVPYLESAVSASEVRSVEALCRDAMARSLPAWFNADAKVGQAVVSSWPGDLLDSLGRLRAVMEQAVHLAELAPTDSATETDTPGLPRSYAKLSEPLQRFLDDREHRCENYDKNVFVMTRLERRSPILDELHSTITETLSEHGLNGHRADDRTYTADSNLWDNVCTYMFGCRYGIAVLEHIVKEEFNPNIALEYGFMRALGKPTLLLKERRFTPNADILGTIWKDFGVDDVRNSVRQSLHAWFKDLNL